MAVRKRGAMSQKSVTSTEFRAKAGVYLDEAGKQPVFITKHDRVTRVVMDIEEYERLIAQDARAQKMKRIAEMDHQRNSGLYKKLAK